MFNLWKERLRGRSSQPAARAPEPAAPDAWLDYPSSGLDPRLRPEGMLLANPFEVPEDPAP